MVVSTFYKFQIAYNLEIVYVAQIVYYPTRQSFSALRSLDLSFRSTGTSLSLSLSLSHSSVKILSFFYKSTYHTQKYNTERSIESFSFSTLKYIEIDVDRKKRNFGIEIIFLSH